MGSPTYGGEALFASGPAWCEVGGLGLRFSEHEPVGVDGASVISQGRESRAVTQRGMLLADTVGALQAQVGAIEGYVDGVGRVLVDELERRWVDVVMLAFEPGRFERVGVRWRVRYRVVYRQVRV